MAPLNRFTIVVAVATGAAVFVPSLIAQGALVPTPLVSGTVPLVFLGAWTLASLPVAFVMPRLRASFFGRQSHRASRRYIFASWVVRLCIGILLGEVLGFALVGIVLDHRVLWMAGSSLIILVAFAAGAWGRLSGQRSGQTATP